MTPADRILVIGLLFLSVFSYTILRSLFPSDINRTAIVEVRGEEVRRLSLDPDIPSRKIVLNIEGGEAVLEIADGRIRMIPMSDKLCSKHICSKKGWISRAWDIIVCLPNRIVVRVVGEKEAGEIDLISR